MANEAATNVATSEKGGAMQTPQPMRMLNPFEEMDRMMESFFLRGWLRPFLWERPMSGDFSLPFEGRMPKVDVVDRDEEILVRAEVPGVEKKDLEISVSDNTVTISGKTHHEEKEEKGNYYRCEVKRGTFSRTVALPADVDAGKAKADFKDGMLELTLPKPAKSKRHTIKLD